MGLTTLLGRKAQGFFIPYRYAPLVRPISYSGLAPLFEEALPRMRRLLALIDRHEADLARFGGPAPNPRFDQEWFPRLDAAVLYVTIRETRPRNIVEIGSGHSTRIMARAIKDGGIACRLVCVDPAPRAEIAYLPVEHVRQPLEPAVLSGLLRLGAGDVLFIDSSHIAMPGSDVDLLVNEVLPRLPAGCRIHVHDVFLPDPYPAAWHWRGYNEQLLLAPLLAGHMYKIDFASHFLVTSHPELVAASCIGAVHLPANVHESSLWLCKC